MRCLWLLMPAGLAESVTLTLPSTMPQRKKEYTFMDLMARLTAKQKGLLTTLARSCKNVRPTSEELIRKHRFTTASAIQRSQSALQDKDIVTNENGKYYI